MEVLLKKCPNITSIELSQSFGRYDYNGVFQLIIKNCNNLRQMKFGTFQLTDRNIDEFQLKFGPKIKFLYPLNNVLTYNLFPNIEKLKFDDYKGFQRYPTTAFE